MIEPGYHFSRDEDPTFFSTDPDPVGKNADPDPTLNRNEEKIYSYSVSRYKIRYYKPSFYA